MATYTFNLDRPNGHGGASAVLDERNSHDLLDAIRAYRPGDVIVVRPAVGPGMLDAYRPATRDELAAAAAGLPPYAARALKAYMTALDAPAPAACEVDHDDPRAADYAAWCTCAADAAALQDDTDTYVSASALHATRVAAPCEHWECALMGNVCVEDDARPAMHHRRTAPTAAAPLTTDTHRDHVAPGVRVELDTPIGAPLAARGAIGTVRGTLAGWNASSLGMRPIVSYERHGRAYRSSTFDTVDAR